MNKSSSISRLSVVVFLLSIFTLSACGIKDELKTKILDKAVEIQNKVDDKIDQKITEEKSDQTDEEMLKELGSDDSFVDNDFSELETELQ